MRDARSVHAGKPFISRFLYSLTEVRVRGARSVRAGKPFISRARLFTKKSRKELIPANSSTISGEKRGNMRERNVFKVVKYQLEMDEVMFKNSTPGGLLHQCRAAGQGR